MPQLQWIYGMAWMNHNYIMRIYNYSQLSCIFVGKLKPVKWNKNVRYQPYWVTPTLTKNPCLIHLVPLHSLTHVWRTRHRTHWNRPEEKMMGVYIYFMLMRFNASSTNLTCLIDYVLSLNLSASFLFTNTVHISGFLCRLLAAVANAVCFEYGIE